MTWLRRLLPLWPWAVALLAVLGYGCEERRAASLGTETRILRGERDALLRHAAVARTTFVHDTVIVTRSIDRFRTRVDSILRVDTLHDTLTVRERVIVAAADTAIKACQATVHSCAQSLAIADSVHALDVRTIRALERAKPGPFRRWGERLLWGSAGYTLRTLTAK